MVTQGRKPPSGEGGRPGACYHVIMRVRALLTALAGAAALAAVTAATAVGAVPLQIAFNSSDESTLSLGTTAGNDGQVIFQTDGSTSISALSIAPDGSNVLVLDNADQDQLALVPVGGGDPVLIDGTIGADSGSFSPDGKSILFSIGQNTSDTLSPGLYSVSVSGGTPKQLLASPDGATDSGPQLSPNGTQLAFVRDAIAGDGTETVTLEVAPAAGGAATELADTLAPTVDGGQHLSFSPDGKTIAYAGDYSDQGIFTVAVSGGASAQLTSDSDYWPIFSPDGSTVFFSRNAFSANADDQAASPVDPIDEDLNELWVMNADGSGAAVIAEGDFVSLAAAPDASTASGGGGGGGGGTGGGGSSGGSGGGSGGGSTGGSHGGSPGGGSIPQPSYGKAVHVAVHGKRYVVTWKGNATAWTVVLAVGRLTVMANVKGSVHSHTFTLRGAKGAAHAVVRGA